MTYCKFCPPVSHIGPTLHICDRSLYLRVLCATGRLYEEYKEFADSFLQLKGRSRSLSEPDYHACIEAFRVFLRTTS